MTCAAGIVQFGQLYEIRAYGIQGASGCDQIIDSYEFLSSLLACFPEQAEQ